MAVGAMIVVLVAMVACATLLPALLAICGRWISPGRPDPGMFRRWSERVVARPGLAAAGALAILLLLAVPALGLRTGEGALRQFPKDNETRVGFDAARSLRGAGDITPLRVLVRPKDLEAAVKVLRADPDVVKTGVRTITKDHQWEFAVVRIKYDADDARAKTVVQRLRRTLPPGSLVGGDTAAQMDFDHAITSSLWKVIVWILAATFVLLVVMLRAVPLALSAIVANLLSVAASLGVLTAAMTWGTGGTGYVDTVVIPIVIAVVFGLSMDYEVFLLSRIHERHAAGASTRDAVLEGIAASGRTITGAALVMVAVFACFAVTGVPVIREIGLGAGVAIAVDATLVRLVLVPAIIVLLGDRAWWAPGRRRQPEAVLSS
jgi:RND superfamily putative drug exporter